SPFPRPLVAGLKRRRRRGAASGWDSPLLLSADPVVAPRLPGRIVPRTERDQRMYQAAQPPRVGERASPGGAPAEDRLDDGCDHDGQSERKEQRERERELHRAVATTWKTAVFPSARGGCIRSRLRGGAGMSDERKLSRRGFVKGA